MSGGNDAEANVANSAGTTTASAEEGVGTAPQHRPGSDVTFESVLDLAQNPTGASPKLRGGEIARSADWPASLFARFNTPEGQSVCTAALVGPQAMLTAAHCVPTSGTVRFVLAGQNYSTQCEQHPRYASGQDDSADYALCKVERSVVAPVGFRFERISRDPMDGLINQRVTLSGYGCISDIVRDGQIDGRYRIGHNTVDETSNSTSQRRGAAYYAQQQRNNLFTKDDPALANLCPGDSGGPAFRVTGSGYDSRQIIGVNSRVFYRDSNRTSYGSSLISATGAPDFSGWALGWARDRARVAVCGVHGAIPNCRS